MAAGALIEKPSRHALLRIDSEAWAAVLADRPDLSDEPLLQDWAPKWPVIARRRAPDDGPGTIPVGIPLPPSHGKRRVALELQPDLIRTVEPPPQLSAIRAAVSEKWGRTVDAVLALGISAGVAPRVFGSVAWGALTGLDYVGPFSDLDLLWSVTAETDVDVLLAGLARIDAAAAPGRLDGEVIVGASKMAVNWRELHRGGDVLVKTIDTVALQSAAWFLEARES